MFQTKAVAKITTHILCSIFFFENLTCYDIMWKNIVSSDRQRVIVWSMLVACWIPQATNIVSEYVIIIAFPFNL